MDLDHRVPLLLGHRADVRVTEDPSVVDEHVEAAERVQRALDERLAARPGRDIVGVGDRIAGGGSDLLHHCAAAEASAPLPSEPPPRSLTTTFAPSEANSRACSRPI